MHAAAAFLFILHMFSLGLQAFVACMRDHLFPFSRFALQTLELVRRGRLSTRQEQLFDEIWLEPAPPRAAAATPTPAA